jgi:tripartite-type tricarboxylate transporter receptor subunit TctC
LDRHPVLCALSTPRLPSRPGFTQALQPITRDPEVVKLFANLGIDALGTTPEQAAASIRKDMPVYSQIVDLAGVRRR